MRKTLFVIFTLIIFYSSGVMFAGNDVVAVNNLKYYKVISVIDGDTIKVKVGGKIESVRLIGIDAPELNDRYGKEQCFSEEAKNKVEEELLNKKVKLLADASQGNRDSHKRLLRYVILKNGRNFNKVIIENGHAREYTTKKAYEYADEFKKAQENAIKNKKGLWNKKTCNGERYKTTKHIYYTSSYYTTKYYYCDTDSVWKNLSKKYLQVFSSVEELLKSFPNRILHKAC